RSYQPARRKPGPALGLEVLEDRTALSFFLAGNYPVGGGAHCVALDDFNGDGHLDLVTGNWGGSITVRLGRGDGTVPTRTDPPAGANPHCVTTGDFNGDGRRDIATTNWGSSNVGVYLGNGDGTFRDAVYTPVGRQPVHLAAGNFTNNSTQDLAVVCDP